MILTFVIQSGRFVGICNGSQRYQSYSYRSSQDGLAMRLICWALNTPSEGQTNIVPTVNCGLQHISKNKRGAKPIKTKNQLRQI
jgi:hypothetical protein